MRLIVDTNVLVSALLAENSLPAHLIVLWREGRFDLLSCIEQFDELARVTRYPKIRARLAPALAGRLINELRDLAVLVADLPVATISPDPNGPQRQLPARDGICRIGGFSCDRRQAASARPRALRKNVHPERARLSRAAAAAPLSSNPGRHG